MDRERLNYDHGALAVALRAALHAAAPGLSCAGADAAAQILVQRMRLANERGGQARGVRGASFAAAAGAS